jgi:hypothetical protein
MHLWRSLPQGQLGAVMTWLFSRRKPVASAAGQNEPDTRGAADLRTTPTPLD